MYKKSRRGTTQHNTRAWLQVRHKLQRKTKTCMIHDT